VHSSNNHSASV